MLYQLSYSREFEAGPAASGATGCHVHSIWQATKQKTAFSPRPASRPPHPSPRAPVRPVRRPPVRCAPQPTRRRRPVRGPNVLSVPQPNRRQRPVRRPPVRCALQPNSRRGPVRRYTDRRGASLARNEVVVLQDQIDVSHQGANAYDKPARPAQGTGKPAQTQGLTIFHTKQQTRFSGGCWIRTNVGNAGRFTACSLWPLGQPSEVQHRASGGTRTPNHLFTKQVLCQLSYASRERTRIFASRGAARDSEQVSEASSVHGQDRQWPGGTSRAAPRAHQKKGAPHPYFPP
jgi:hypothetical protein